MSQFMHSTLKMEGILTCETLRTYKPTKRRNISEDLISQYQNRFATNKIFHRCVISSGKSGDLPATPAVSIRCGNLSCFLPLVTKPTGRLAVIIVALLRQKLTLWRTHILPSLLMSHTYTSFKRQV
jgi:hypothetical protein